MSIPQRASQSSPLERVSQLFRLPDRVAFAPGSDAQQAAVVIATDPAISLVIPTRNEAQNIVELWRRIDCALAAIPAEIIFVDDSDDETPTVIASLPRRLDREVVLIHRPRGSRNGGLGGAVVQGFRAARGDWFGVMDADLQHPPEMLPNLIGAARSGYHDLVIASRYCAEGEAGGLSALRAKISRGSTMTAKLLFPEKLEGVTDPMSGFFLVRRAAVDPDLLQPKGFKILLEMIARTPSLRIAEVPFHFAERLAGESKATTAEGFRYVRQLLALRMGSGSLRFIGFGLVGLSGLVVNTLLLAFNAQVLGLFYILAAVLATQGSSVWNFVLTDRLVFTNGPRQARWRRFALFLAMNNASFVLRGPMMYTLTTGFGMHYLASNVLSLIALLVLRFTTADRWIWGNVPPRPSQPPFSPSVPALPVQEGA